MARELAVDKKQEIEQLSANGMPKRQIARTLDKGKKWYRYYICTSAQKKGWSTCESKSIPAQQIEDFVVEQIRSAQYPPELLAKSLQSLSGKNQHRRLILEEELRLLGRDTDR